MRSPSRRVLALWIVSLVLAGLAGAWFHHLLTPKSAEERMREEAERIKERIHDVTH